LPTVVVFVAGLVPLSVSVKSVEPVSTAAAFAPLSRTRKVLYSVDASVVRYPTTAERGNGRLTIEERLAPAAEEQELVDDRLADGLVAPDAIALDLVQAREADLAGAGSSPSTATTDHLGTQS
jgi:hypothetical protein